MNASLDKEEKLVWMHICLCICLVMFNFNWRALSHPVSNLNLLMFTLNRRRTLSHRAKNSLLLRERLTIDNGISEIYTFPLNLKYKMFMLIFLFSSHTMLL